MMSPFSGAPLGEATSAKIMRLQKFEQVKYHNSRILKREKYKK